jgi:hypothetical protein
VVVEAGEDLQASVRRARGTTETARVTLAPEYGEATLLSLLMALEQAGIKSVRLEAPARPITFRIGKLDEKARFYALRHDDQLALADMNAAGPDSRTEPWQPGDQAAERALHDKLNATCGSSACSVQLALTTTGTQGFLAQALASWDRVVGGTVGLRASVTFPKVKMGATTVSGALPPAEIQRVVRENFGKFRMCYEAGLGRDAKLRGLVKARFVIGRDGKVSVVKDGGSELPDAEVVACVLEAFKTLEFPPPVGGIVTVVYPIQLEPG